MNRGVLHKSWREVWLSTLLLGLGFMSVEAALAYILPTFHGDFSGYITKMPFVKNLIQALLGTEVGENFSRIAFNAFPWVHPVALTILWAHIIILVTRVPAGEVDRGTMDVLLSWPISRWQLIISETVVWMLSGLGIILLGLAGSRLGGLGIPPQNRAALSSLIIVLANLYCLYLAVGGLTCLVSCLSERRGRAVGLVFAIVLASFFLNFLAQYWAPARQFSFLSILHYYKPLSILLDARWPIWDMSILVGSGLILWLAGGIVFARRDICTS